MGHGSRLEISIFLIMSGSWTLGSVVLPTGSRHRIDATAIDTHLCWRVDLPRIDSVTVDHCMTGSCYFCYSYQTARGGWRSDKRPGSSSRVILTAWIGRFHVEHDTR